VINTAQLRYQGKMKKLNFLTTALAIVATLASASIVLAQSKSDVPNSITPAQPKSDDPNWINPSILKQLQDIQPIDRSKIKPDRLQQIALQLTRQLKDVSITLGKSETLLPELNIPPQKMLVVKGITKLPMGIKGQLYPAGLEHQSFYNEKGEIIATSTALPILDPKGRYPVGMDPDSLRGLENQLRTERESKK
jgi:hypothetical protein